MAECKDCFHFEVCSYASHNLPVCDSFVCKNNEWLKTEDGYDYKRIGENGKWEIIKFKGDGAFYSFCPSCDYIHSCYKNVRNYDTGQWEGIKYAPENEFNYCPMCGEKMLNN